MTQDRPRDHYETLGIARTATPSQVTLAFFDRVGNVGGAGAAPDAERTRELYRAYEVLSNTERRKEYDAQLFGSPQDGSHRGRRHAPPPAPDPRPVTPVPTAPYGVTGASYPLRPLTAPPRRSSRRLRRPRGVALVTLALLVAYCALTLAGSLGAYTSHLDEVLGVAGPLLVTWGLMAWAGVIQVRRRRRMPGYLLVVALQVLAVLGGLSATGLAGGLLLAVGPVLYVATVELWRRQQLS